MIPRPFVSSARRVAIVCPLVLGGCAVVAVVDTAGSVAAKTVGLAADAAVGTVKIAGRAAGKVADAALGSDDRK